MAFTWDDQLQGSLTGWRDAFERIAASCGVEVAIHTKPCDSKPKMAAKKPGTDAILVKKAEGATYASTLRLVRDEVLSKGSANTVRGVRETKPETLY